MFQSRFKHNLGISNKPFLPIRAFFKKGFRKSSFDLLVSARLLGDELLTSNSTVSAYLLDLWAAGIEYFVASPEAGNRQIPFSTVNYPEIHINRLTRGLQ
jgi:hypothetical protein